MTTVTESEIPKEVKLSPGADLTPVYSSFFHVRVSDNMSRLVFGDNIIGEPTRYHTAIVMTTENILLLAGLIEKLKRENDEKLAKSKASEAP